MSRTHGEPFLKTSLQASTVHMQAVAIARHMLGIYNTFSPSPSFLLFDRGADRQEHTRPHAHCSSHTCVHSAQIRAHKGREHQWRESRWECKGIGRTHKQPHVHRQTDVRGNLPTLNTLKNTTRHLTAVPGWGGKKEKKTERERFEARRTQLDMETSPSPNIHSLGSQHAGTDRWRRWKLTTRTIPSEFPYYAIEKPSIQADSVNHGSSRLTPFFFNNFLLFSFILVQYSLNFS